MGFIRDISATFRATLDELHVADVLFHVIDVSNQNFESHIRAVEKVLEELDISGKPTIRVFNKENRFSDKAMLQNLCESFGAIAVSALNAEILSPLIERMELMVNQSAQRSILPNQIRSRYDESMR